MFRFRASEDIIEGKMRIEPPGQGNCSCIGRGLTTGSGRASSRTVSNSDGDVLE